MDGLASQPSTVPGPPYLLPRYLQPELSRHHVLRNIARFRLHAHTLS